MRKLAVAAVLVCLIAITLPASVAAQNAPPFVGVRTFLSAPYEPDLDKLHADFAVLGVPFDEGTWGQPVNAMARATCAKIPRNMLTI